MGGRTQSCEELARMADAEPALIGKLLSRRFGTSLTQKYCSSFNARCSRFRARVNTGAVSL